MHRSPLALLAAVLAASACNVASPASPATPDAGAGAATSDAPADAPAAPLTCAGKAPASGDSVWTVMSGGVPRLVNVHIPTSYDPTQPTPLVLNFHGFTSDAVQEALLSQMSPLADANGFIVMYPVGTGAPLSWNAGACCGTAAATGVDDI